MEKKYIRFSRKVIAFVIAVTMLTGSIYGNVTLEAAKKKPSLYVKTAKYTRTNQTKKVKKTQTIRVKNLSSKMKVSWKSSNKKLAAVKAGKKGKAKLVVSLKKAGTAQITATVRNKKTNKKVKVLKKKISVVNKKVTATENPIIVTNTPIVLPTIPPTDVPTESATKAPTAEPTESATKAPTAEPTESATKAPTAGPTESATEAPTTAPTVEPPIIHTPSPYDLWVGTWGSSQYSVTLTGDDPKLTDSTFRQVIRISTGGHKLRFTFSNEYGQTPMEIKSVHIAKPTVNGSSNIDTSTDTMVTFNEGSESVTIPAGKKVISDEIDYPAAAMEKIAVSTYFGSMPTTLTHHGGARATSFLQTGNAVSAETMGTVKNTRWYVLSNIDVLAPPESRAIVCFGDSITDGFGTDQYNNQKPDNYLRWTDVLAQNLQSNRATQHLSVVNMGIGGNAVFGGQGPAARDRFDRDVLQTTGVGYLVFMIGVNDINAAASTDTTLAGRLTAEYTKMIEKAQAQGIKVFAGTITPTYGSSYFSERREEIRQEVNTWLRQMYEDGNVDALVDFDKLLTEPGSNPPALRIQYNNDGLHPNIAGYQAMGELVYQAMCNEVSQNPTTPRTPPPATTTPPSPTPIGDYVVDLSTFISDGKGVTTYDSESEVLSIRGDEIVHFALPYAVLNGESVNVIVEGNWTAESLGWRSYLTSSTSVTNTSDVSNNGTPFSGTPGETYRQVFKLTSSNDGSKYLAIRGVVGPKPINLDITKIVLPVELPTPTPEPTPDPTPKPTQKPGMAVLSDENLGENDWYIGPVTLEAPEGFKISFNNEPEGSWSDSLLLDSTEGAGKNAAYYLKDGSGNISEQKTVSYKVDVTAPEADISLRESVFSTFLSEVTYDLFFKDSVVVKIGGEDVTSDVAKTEYQVVSGEAAFDTNGTWETGDLVIIGSANKHTVYARVTDYAGNQTIVNSNGVVLYTDSFLEKAAGEFCPVSEAPCYADVSADMNLYGNTLKEIALRGSDGTLTLNQEYTIEENTVTFKKEYLGTLIQEEGDKAVFEFSFLPMGLDYVEADGNQPPSKCIFTVSYVEEDKEPEKETENPDEYVCDLSGFAADSNGTTTYDSTNKLLKIRGNQTVYFALPETLFTNEEVSVTVKGNWTGTSLAWRAYLTSSSSSVTSTSNVSNAGIAFTGTEGESFSQTFTLTSTTNTSKFIAIRGAAGSSAQPINLDIKKITMEITLDPYGGPTPDPNSENTYTLDLTSLTSARTSGATQKEGGIALGNATTPSGTSGASVGVNLPPDVILTKGDSVIVLIKGTVTGENDFNSYRMGLATEASYNWNSTATLTVEPPRRSPILPGKPFVIAKVLPFDANNTPTCIYFQLKSQGEITIESIVIEVKKAS